MVRLLVTFMQQRQPPSGAPLAAPVPGAQIGSERMDVPTYLALYRAVGEASQWDERLRMPERALDEFLRAESTIVRVLRVQGGAVGLLEAVRHEGPEFEIVHFGIVPAAQGRGLGRYLLDFGLRSLWQQKPMRIWLRTDTNDHPAAVGTYEKAGFSIFACEWMDFPD